MFSHHSFWDFLYLPHPKLAAIYYPTSIHIWQALFARLKILSWPKTPKKAIFTKRQRNVVVDKSKKYGYILIIPKFWKVPCTGKGKCVNLHFEQRGFLFLCRAEVITFKIDDFQIFKENVEN